MLVKFFVLLLSLFWAIGTNCYAENANNTTQILIKNETSPGNLVSDPVSTVKSSNSSSLGAENNSPMKVSADNDDVLGNNNTDANVVTLSEQGGLSLTPATNISTSGGVKSALKADGEEVLTTKFGQGVPSGDAISNVEVATKLTESSNTSVLPTEPEKSSTLTDSTTITANASTTTTAPDTETSGWDLIGGALNILLGSGIRKNKTAKAVKKSSTSSPTSTKLTLDDSTSTTSTKLTLDDSTSTTSTKLTLDDSTSTTSTKLTLDDSTSTPSSGANLVPAAHDNDHDDYEVRAGDGAKDTTTTRKALNDGETTSQTTTHPTTPSSKVDPSKKLDKHKQKDGEKDAKKDAKKPKKPVAETTESTTPGSVEVTRKTMPNGENKLVEDEVIEAGNHSTTIGTPEANVVNAALNRQKDASLAAMVTLPIFANLLRFH